jgi:putative ABC transport system permease protein
MASIQTMESIMSWYFQSWHHPSTFIYLEMQQVEDPTRLKQAVQSIAEAYQPDYVKEEQREYGIQSLFDIHLHSDLISEWEVNSDRAYLRIYMLSGLFILLIACVNFINIAAAHSAGRAQEVGLRKVFGSRRQQIVNQFLTESFLFFFLSFLLAILLADGILSFVVSPITGKEIIIWELADFRMVLMALLFILIIAMLAGMYPSLVLSYMRPAKVLRGRFETSSSSWLRKLLVGFQFLISCLLISITIIVNRQVNFTRDSDPGFDREHLMSIHLSDRYAKKNYEVLKEALLSEPEIQSVALSSTLPGRGNFHGFELSTPEAPSNPEKTLQTLGADENFIRTFGLQLVDGRDFSPERLTDLEAGFILNESAALRFGWDEPVGKELELTYYTEETVVRRGHVIGLVEDFHFESLHNHIAPLVMYVNKHPYYSEYLTVKFKPGLISNVLATIKPVWKDFHPEKPLEYVFLDEDIDHLYTTEIRISGIFRFLTVISILISCLGLFGLSTYNSERKTKEAGIRKVWGASMMQVFSLQLRESLYLVLGANIFTWPFAIWWAFNWLSSFAYHIEIKVQYFAFSLLIAVVLVLLTILYHSLRIARMNPVDTIRYE